VIVEPVDVSPVTFITLYVNIGELPLNGLIDDCVNNVINIPEVTVPETEGLTDAVEIVNVLPDVNVVLSTTKLGFIVYADVVYNVNPLVVFPVKNPLGAVLISAAVFFIMYAIFL